MSVDRERLIIAVMTGLLLASLCSLWVMVLWVGGGWEGFRERGIPLWGAVTSYLVGAVLGGAIVGALWPIGRSLFGAILLGYVAALPFFAAISVRMSGVGTSAIESSSCFDGILVRWERAGR